MKRSVLLFILFFSVFICSCQAKKLSYNEILDEVRVSYDYDINNRKTDIMNYQENNLDISKLSGEWYGVADVFNLDDKKVLTISNNNIHIFYDEIVIFDNEDESKNFKITKLEKNKIYIDSKKNRLVLKLYPISKGNYIGDKITLSSDDDIGETYVTFYRKKDLDEYRSRLSVLQNTKKRK